MNTEQDPSMERTMAALLAGMAPGLEPAGLADDLLSTTGQMRPRPRWLAYLKEPPMRISSRVAVGSPTARLAAIAIATMLLAALAGGAVVAGASLISGPGVIVVAQDGSGTYTTISEAVAAAADGDTILVRPGRYAEHIVIDKDITVEGDGPRENVVIPYDEDSPTWTDHWGANLPNAITLLNASATLRHLSIEGLEYGIGIAVHGGDVLLEDLSIVLPGEYGGRGRWAIHFAQQAAGTVRDITARGYIAITDDSAPTIERVKIMQDSVWLSDSGAATVVRDSDLPFFYAQGYAQGSVVENRIVGIVEIEGGLLELRDNAIGLDGEAVTSSTLSTASSAYGVVIISGSPRLLGNTIVGKVTGIQVGFGAAPLIEGTPSPTTPRGSWSKGWPCQPCPSAAIRSVETGPTWMRRPTQR